ncbi:hypothetical protein CsSME_00042029 [Camellia sinensis var. sinensis]
MVDEGGRSASPTVVMDDRGRSEIGWRWVAMSATTEEDDRKRRTRRRWRRRRIGSLSLPQATEDPPSLSPFFSRQ